MTARAVGALFVTATTTALAHVGAHDAWRRPGRFARGKGRGAAAVDWPGLPGTAAGPGAPHPGRARRYGAGSRKSAAARHCDGGS
jgi:hypothetical protein